MMTPDQYILCKIAEEGSEVAKRALKAQQFGLDEVQPGQELTNYERLCAEFRDLVSSVAVLVQETEDMTVSDEDNSQRLQRMQRYLLLSQSLGMVDPEFAVDTEESLEWE